MKNKIIKLALMLPIVALPMTHVSYMPNSKNNGQANKAKEYILFEGKVYTDINSIYNHLLTTNRMQIEEVRLIGDMYNSYIDPTKGLLNKSKLPDYNPLNLEFAWEKANGQLTRNYDEAVKTYFNEGLTRMEYSDGYSNETFATREEAEISRNKRISFPEIGFYELPTYNSGVYGANERYNPLNTMDYDLFEKQLKDGFWDLFYDSLTNTNDLNKRSDYYEVVMKDMNTYTGDSIQISENDSYEKLRDNASISKEVTLIDKSEVKNDFDQDRVLGWKLDKFKIGTWKPNDTWNGDIVWNGMSGFIDENPTNTQFQIPISPLAHLKITVRNFGTLFQNDEQRINYGKNNSDGTTSYYETPFSNFYFTQDELVKFLNLSHRPNSISPNHYVDNFGTVKPWTNKRIDDLFIDNQLSVSYGRKINNALFSDNTITTNEDNLQKTQKYINSKFTETFSNDKSNKLYKVNLSGLNMGIDYVHKGEVDNFAWSNWVNGVRISEINYFNNNQISYNGTASQTSTLFQQVYNFMNMKLSKDKVATEQVNLFDNKYTIRYNRRVDGTVKSKDLFDVSFANKNNRIDIDNLILENVMYRNYITSESNSQLKQFNDMLMLKNGVQSEQNSDVTNFVNPEIIKYSSISENKSNSFDTIIENYWFNVHKEMKKIVVDESKGDPQLVKSEKYKSIGFESGKVIYLGDYEPLKGGKYLLNSFNMLNPSINSQNGKIQGSMLGTDILFNTIEENVKMYQPPIQPIIIVYNLNGEKINVGVGADDESYDLMALIKFNLLNTLTPQRNYEYIYIKGYDKPVINEVNVAMKLSINGIEHYFENSDFLHNYVLDYINLNSIRIKEK